MEFPRRLRFIVLLAGLIFTVVEFSSKMDKKFEINEKLGQCEEPLPKFNAEKHEYPWIVDLKITFEQDTVDVLQHKKGFRYQCGGTIIRKNWILTAAHCLIKDSASVYKIKIVAGIFNLSDFSDNGVQIREDASFVIHADYKYEQGFVNGIDQFGIENDVALIELDEDLEINEFVQIAPIGEMGIHELGWFSNCETAGWGQIISGKGQNAAETLMKAKPQIIQLLESTIITNAVMGKGDSGGPIFCRSQFSIFDKRLHLVGILSGSNQPSHYPRRKTNVFMRLSYYMEWIDNQIISEKPKSKSIKSYELKVRNRFRDRILILMLGFVIVSHNERVISFFADTRRTLSDAFKI